MSKIYTKQGDEGETGLYNGKRVPKNHVIMEACGTIDEVNASIGLILTCVKNEIITIQLKSIQQLLFTIGAVLANPASSETRPSPADIEHLERAIDDMTSQLPPLKNFILPGGTLLAARIHITRSIVRRAERRVVTVSQHNKVPDNIIRYLNRLSDYFFVLARYGNYKTGIQDQLWASNE